jgi:predicted Zn-dependent protease
MEESQSKSETHNCFSMEKICQSNNFIKNLLEIIESHPNESAVNFGRSIIYFINDDFDKMLECLELLTKSFPNISLLHRRIAEAHLYKNSYPIAITHLEKVLELDTKDLTARVWLVLSYFKVGKAKEANDGLDDLINFVFTLKAIERRYTGLQS